MLLGPGGLKSAGLAGVTPRKLQPNRGFGGVWLPKPCVLQGFWRLRKSYTTRKPRKTQCFRVSQGPGEAQESPGRALGGPRDARRPKMPPKRPLGGAQRRPQGGPGAAQFLAPGGAQGQPQGGPGRAGSGPGAAPEPRRRPRGPKIGFRSSKTTVAYVVFIGRELKRDIG